MIRSLLHFYCYDLFRLLLLLSAVKRIRSCYKLFGMHCSKQITIPILFLNDHFTKLMAKKLIGIYLFCEWTDVCVHGGCSNKRLYVLYWDCCILENAAATLFSIPNNFSHMVWSVGEDGKLKRSIKRRNLLYFRIYGIAKLWFWNWISSDFSSIQTSNLLSIFSFWLLL